MQFTSNFVSAVVLACTSLVAAQNAGPFVPWFSASNTGLCVQPSSQATNAPLIAAACAGTAVQTWSWLKDSGTNVYRLQNGAPPFMCADIVSPGVGTQVIYGECTNSDGSGNPVSNAEWVASAALPNTVTLQSHILRATVVNCITLVDGDLILEPCGSASQGWIVGI
ncbi:hypothetical protein MSAN_01493900 [Mycena sanguinolenta]|uniref:Ricin B lectin domain-containing protein n=1 Tax=Mycena sanguinolenta TaxID=230812 RepID=A0A8H6YCX5_9AGAR|nr:hypothetical protein MSAN_01493900 [Mycena sanguinolenta]